MVSSITEYISYFEAGEDMTNEEYGIYMRAIHNFAYKDIEPDYSTLPPLVKAALRTVIASVRKNKEDRENGAKGGRPSKVTTEQKPRFSENKNPGYEKTETNVNENVNVNVNENDNENVNTLSESEPQNIGALQKELYEIVREHNRIAPNNKKIPVSSTFFFFTAKESRELLDHIGIKEPPDRIKQALLNFIAVAKSDTWRKVFSWSSFCKNYNEFTPEYFSLEKYLEKTKSAKSDEFKITGEVGF